MTTAVPEDTEELAALRAEVQSLRAQLDTRGRRRFALTALRKVVAAVLAALAAFLLVASVVGLWSAYTTLNTSRWVSTVAPLPKQPAVAAAVSQYATDELFRVVDVEQRVKAALPDQAAFLAGPLVGQVKDAIRKTANNVIQSDRFQQIWIEANRRAHQQALAIINQTSDVVVSRGDHVEIDLLPFINQILRQLSAELPTLFGKQITLPDLSSGEIPANLRARVEDAVGVVLPPNFAQFTLYDAGKLQTIQDAVVATKRYLAALVVGTVLLIILALVISPQRRRTVLQLGLWLVVASVAVTASLRAVRKQLLFEVPEGVYRDGVAAALTTITTILRQRGTQLIWLGALVALIAYLVGPGRVPVWLRRQVARGARAAGRWIRAGSQATASRGPGWIAGHLDVIRIAGVVVAVVLALILSSWTALLWIALGLAAFEVAVTLIGRAGARSAPTTGTHDQAGLAGT
jgi:hypothetical protein